MTIMTIMRNDEIHFEFLIDQYVESVSSSGFRKGGLCGGSSRAPYGLYLTFFS